jgi:hypothetical protein
MPVGCNDLNNPDQFGGETILSTSPNTCASHVPDHSELLGGPNFSPFFDPRTPTFVLLLRFFVRDCDFDILSTLRVHLLRLHCSLLFRVHFFLPPRGAGRYGGSPKSHLTVSIDAEVVVQLVITS